MAAMCLAAAAPGCASGEEPAGQASTPVARVERATTTTTTTSTLPSPTSIGGDPHIIEASPRTAGYQGTGGDSVVAEPAPLPPDEPMSFFVSDVTTELVGSHQLRIRFMTNLCRVLDDTLTFAEDGRLLIKVGTAPPCLPDPTFPGPQGEDAAGVPWELLVELGREVSVAPGVEFVR